MVMFGLLPVVIAQNVYQPRAIDSRMQIASGVYFDPTTGITSVILTNTELIGPNKVKEIDDLPLIAVNIPPVLNESGHDAIVKEAKSLESWVIEVFNLSLKRFVYPYINEIKWDASSRWSFRPISPWSSIETTIIRKTHPTLNKT